MFNLFPREGKDKSPDQLFSCSAVDPNISELHPFGCPVCVTVHAKDSAWTKRAHSGVCLGPSPQHASSVGLFDICEVQSADGKPLRGSVMNILFMMEF